MNNALLNYDENQRTSYMLLLASIATADHENSQEEVAFIQQMCEASQISDNGVKQVIGAMKDPSSANLGSHAQSLKGSELRFSLVADVINLAYSDGDLDAQELAQIKNINGAMNISDEQFAALTQYVQKANRAAEQQEQNPALQGLTGEAKGDFLSQSGLLDIFTKANIPGKNFEGGSTIGTVLSGLAAAFLQNKMGGNQQGGSTGGLDLGSIAGAVLGGMSGKSSNQQGGLGGLLGNILNSSQGKNAVTGLINSVLDSNKQGKGLGSLTDLLGGGKKTQGQQGGSPLGSLISAFLQ